MKISSLQDCSVFLDTNILIYAFTTTRFTPACEELLEKVRNGTTGGGCALRAKRAWVQGLLRPAMNSAGYFDRM